MVLHRSGLFVAIVAMLALALSAIVGVPIMWVDAALGNFIRTSRRGHGSTWIRAQASDDYQAATSPRGWWRIRRAAS